MRWTSSADTDIEKLPKYEVMNGNCYLDWICSALARHKDGQGIRKIAGINDGKFILNDESNWELKFRDKNSIINMREPQQQVYDIETIIKRSKKSHMYDEVIRRLEWKYGHYNYTKVPVKVTVTELKDF